MDELEKVHARMDCLRIALEFGTQRDVLDPARLADRYWEWVTRGSEATRPADDRKDGGHTRAKKARSVRKGSALTMNQM